MEGSVCLVTGAAGFIGSHLTERLVRDGARLHAVVRPGSEVGRIAHIADKIVIHRADLEDGDALKACVELVQPEIVFHLGAETRAGTHVSPAAAQLSVKQLLEPLICLVDALDGLPVPPTVLVRAGSIAEYGAVPLPYREDVREAPSNPYGTALLAGTQYLEMLAGKLTFPVITARLALTYGPGQSHTFLLPALIEACVEGRDFEIKRPDDRRDMIHVDEVVDALLCLAKQHDRACRLVNIGTGVAPTMREVAETVVAQTGCDPQRVHFGAGQSTPTELRSDTSRAWKVFGWRASLSMKDGLARLLSAGDGGNLRAGHGSG
ncbi:MAG: NAD(P)-dependent oxidoreductase [Porphyrobacter sp.]|nr:NAD(P)-dependent oxidoreductase [Porphyrobacter sp.]